MHLLKNWLACFNSYPRAEPPAIVQKMTDNAHLRLVTPLTVKLFGKFDLSFDDLDDVVASFVEPITARFRDVVEHERFIDGLKDAVEVWHWGGLAFVFDQGWACSQCKKLLY